MDNNLGDNKWLSAFSKRQHYNNKRNDYDKGTPFLGHRQRNSFLKQNISYDASVDIPPKLEDTLLFPQLSEKNIINSKQIITGNNILSNDLSNDVSNDVSISSISWGEKIQEKKIETTNPIPPGWVKLSYEKNPGVNGLGTGLGTDTRNIKYEWGPPLNTNTKTLLHIQQEKTFDEKVGDVILDMKKRWYEYNQVHGLYYDYDYMDDDEEYIFDDYNDYNDYKYSYFADSYSYDHSYEMNTHLH